MKSTHHSVSKILCSRANWMIEVGRSLKNADELQLVGLNLNTGSAAFLNRLASNVPFDIISNGDIVMLRKR
jgi:hypothetical protein